MRLFDSDWLAAAAAALVDLPEVGGADAVVDYVVSGTPRGKVTVGVTVADGRVTGIDEGRSSEPDVVVSGSYETFASILSGESSADAGYMNGALKVEGAHAQWLLDLRAIRLAAVDLLGPLMADTEI